MNERPSVRDGELLSAYLAGELSDDEVADLEARLRREPALADQLEHTRLMLEQLGRLDEVSPPPGFSERLRARLEAEQADATPQVDAGAEAPASLAAARARKADRSRFRWPVFGTAAAGLVVLALVAGVVIAGLDMDDEAAEDPAPLAEEPEMEAQDVPEADADVEEAPEVVPMAEPVLVDSDITLDDAEDIEAHFADSPAAELLGLPVAEGEELAAAFSVAISRAEPFAAAGEPAACLDPVAAGTSQPVVPAHVESAVHEDAPALAYVAATAREGSTELDRLEAWIVEPATCATRLYVELTPE